MPSTPTNKPIEDRIDVGDDYELESWADKFGVDKERVREAVRRVGDRPGAVARYLNPKHNG